MRPLPPPTGPAWGFVAKGARNTPQAFSHFSYEYTEGRLMIVDIQGVGDYYTDPRSGGPCSPLPSDHCPQPPRSGGRVCR